MTRRRIFLSSSGEQDLRGLAQFLESLGYEPVTAFDTSVAPVWSQAIRSAVEQAEVVLVLVSDVSEAPNAAFEIGVAVAVGKRPVVVAPPEVALPAAAHDLLVVRTTSDNYEAIGDAIRAAEALGAETGTPVWPTEASRPIGGAALSLLAQLDDPALQTPTEQRIQEIVATALREARTMAVEAPQGPDAGFDLAVWDKALEQSIGAPVLIETLGGRASIRRTALKVRQLQATLDAVPSAEWGLLIALHGPSADAAPAEAFSGRVLVIDAHELLRRMQSERFSDIVRDLRNKRVHS